MKNAILISDVDMLHLRKGHALELALDGEQTLTLLYVRDGSAILARNRDNLAKARAALKRIWRSPEGHKKMVRATMEGKKRAALARAQKNGKPRA